MPGALTGGDVNDRGCQCGASFVTDCCDASDFRHSLFHAKVYLDKRFSAFTISTHICVSPLKRPGLRTARLDVDGASGESRASRVPKGQDAGCVRASGVGSLGRSHASKLSGQRTEQDARRCGRRALLPSEKLQTACKFHAMRACVAGCAGYAAQRKRLKHEGGISWTLSTSCLQRSTALSGARR